MKTLGLIGGMSWESTSEYYRIINQVAREKLGPAHSCRSIIYSFDFAEISDLQHSGNWGELSEKMVEIAVRLEKAGAELILICTNTMHVMAEEVQDSIGVPLFHIADAVAMEIRENGMNKVGLLGTRFTMEKEFYSKRLKEKHGIKTIIPSEVDRGIVHNIIYKELISGQFLEKSAEQYFKVIEKLKNKGAQGVILGCTEIPLLLSEVETPLPLFDTTRIHARKAVELILEER